MTIKPPPPIGAACGSTTDRAKDIATDASIALPPFCRIIFPTSVARKCRVTTIESLALTVFPEIVDSE